LIGLTTGRGRRDEEPIYKHHSINLAVNMSSANSFNTDVEEKDIHGVFSPRAHYCVFVFVKMSASACTSCSQ
jgi:hypothetical protein